MRRGRAMGRAVGWMPVVAVVATAARAQGAEAGEVNPMAATRGLELGLTLGIAHPGGSLASGSVGTTPRVSGVMPAWLPIGLEAGYRFGPALYAGVTALWGASVGEAEACPACSFQYDFQGRADLRFYTAPTSTFDPWLSAGFGWEVMHLTLGQTTTASATYDGPLLLNLGFGVDVRTKALAIGPYFALALGELIDHHLSPASPGVTSGVPSPAVHEWFTFGVRGTYGPR